jgi:hypothetical protein
VCLQLRVFQEQTNSESGTERCVTSPLTARFLFIVNPCLLLKKSVRTYDPLLSLIIYSPFLSLFEPSTGSRERMKALEERLLKMALAGVDPTL